MNKELKKLIKEKLPEKYHNTSLMLLHEYIILEYGLYAEIFYSMYFKKWSVNNYFVDYRKGKKILPKGNLSIKFDDYFDALELAIWEMLKLI